jgi:DNA-binding MarR family transcriptional regulator
MTSAAAKKQGEFTPSDHKELGFKSPNTLSPHIKSLESAGLVDSTRDETDQRRRTITLTGKGWLVDWAQTIS